MRHAKRTQRLSRPTEQRQALVDGLVRGLVVHGQILTTHARAKEAQRVADRLVTWGKEGSIASRRMAFRILQDRTLVKRLFAEIAPQFTDVAGGYTRVLRASRRLGDGAQESVLAFTRRVMPEPSVRPTPAPAQAPKAPPAAPLRPATPRRAEAPPKGPRGLFGGLRKLWTRQKKGSGTS